jgi:hypothetical protein
MTKTRHIRLQGTGSNSLPAVRMFPITQTDEENLLEDQRFLDSMGSPEFRVTHAELIGGDKPALDLTAHWNRINAE